VTGTTVRGARPPRTGRVFGRLALVELKLFLREPLTVVFTLAFPPMILVVLGAAFGNSPPDPSVWQGLPAMHFYLPAYVGLVLASVGLIALPVHLAAYRERGVLRRFLASPIPVAALLVAQLAVALVIGAVGCVVVVVLGMTAYDVPAPRQVPALLLTYLVCALFFATAGFLLGMLMPSTRAAQGLGMLIFFVMLFLGGTSPPLEVFSGVLRAISTALPLTRSVYALLDPWVGRGINGPEVLGLAAGTLVAGATALWLLAGSPVPRIPWRAGRGSPATR
jgi:ABC-2 type transport system permease protein